MIEFVVKQKVLPIGTRKYNPQNEMFHVFETKRSKPKTKCYFSSCLFLPIKTQKSCPKDSFSRY